MGQKTNSTIFRLSLKTSEWNQKYLEKNNEESTLYLYKNVEIQDYIGVILNNYNFFTHSCKIEYCYNNVNVIIYYYHFNTINKNYNLKNKINNNNIKFLITNVITPSLNIYIKNKIINVKAISVNKNFETSVKKNKKMFNEFKNTQRLFKKFFRIKWQKELIKLLFISCCTQYSSKLIANTISYYINKQKKKHNYLLFVFKKTFNTLIKSKFSNIKGIKIIITGRFNGAPRAKKRIIQIGTISLQNLNNNINYFNSVSYTSNGTLGVKVWTCVLEFNYVFTTKKVKI